MVNFLLIFAVTVVIAGCGIQSDMDQMKAQTEALGRQTNHLEVGEDNLFQGGRDAIQIQLGKLLKDVEDADGVHAKCDAAVKYTSAFSFQNWQGTYADTPQRREVLYRIAIEDFFSATRDKFDNTSPVPFHLYDRFLVNWPNFNSWLTVGALSYAIGRNNPVYVLNGQLNNFKPVSFYDLITTALQMKHDKKGPYPEWAQQVINYEKPAIEFLQMRHNFLPLLMLGDLPGFEKDRLTQLRMILPAIRPYDSWSYDIDRFNSVEVDTHIQFLKDAHDTREFLKSIGEELSWSFFMVGVFRYVEFTSKKSPVLRDLLNGDLTENDLTPAVASRPEVVQTLTLKKYWDELK